LDFAGSYKQFCELDEFLADFNIKICAVFYIEVSNEEIRTRLANRGRTDDMPKLIEKRLIVYQQQINPILRHYEEQGLLYEVNNSGSIEKTVEKISNILNEALEGYSKY
jgi:adenylate kinase family enzyme